MKPKIGVLTVFAGSDSAYSLVNVVQTQLKMLLDGGYNPVLFVCPSFPEGGFWDSSKFEIRRHLQPDAVENDIYPKLHSMVNDIDIMLCHDIVFLSPQHDEWANSVRRLAKKFPHISWLHWQHSRGDHVVSEPCENSWYCYPNQGDLAHLAAMNKTTVDRTVYIPHPLDMNYMGWPELAIRIAEDTNYPFVDVSGILPGRLDRQKQIDKAIRLYAGIKRAGKSVCFICADAYATGERFKEYKKDCLEIAKEQGLTEDEFLFLGERYPECAIATPRPVVKALYEMGNLFVQPSNSETSSLVAMEAALAGNLLVLNANFPPIHHLYKKAITLDFGSVMQDVKYYRNITTADGETTKVEDKQMYWDDQGRETVVPILSGQISLAVKRQQFRDRWPSQVFKNHLEPLLQRVYNPAKAIALDGHFDRPHYLSELDPKLIERALPTHPGNVYIPDTPPPIFPLEPEAAQEAIRDLIDKGFYYSNPKLGGDPEVTAIITTLDNLDLLKKQINVLSEEVGHLIVVSNGSKDGTNEWLDANPIERMQVIKRDNLGAGPGRNAGLALWDKNPTPYTVTVDGGILPPYGGVAAMKKWLLDHPSVEVISPEIYSCYTTEPAEAMTRVSSPLPDTTFEQRCLSSTAYGMQRASAWRVRFSEEGPFGEPGWGVDDNEMAYRWDEAGVIHHDFTSALSGWKLYRRASGSFQRLSEETGIWPTQYGSVYEKRCVKMYQEWSQYLVPPIISCVAMSFNNYPLFAQTVKRLHDELADIPHEVIVVDNASTDETKKWLDDHALRQAWGDTTIDSVTGAIVKRTPENEDIWSGNVIRIELPENLGVGNCLNKGIEKARGKYIFFIDGDKYPVKGTVVGMYEQLEKHPEYSYLTINSWCSQDDDMNPEFLGFDNVPVQGLGNFAYGYAMIRREVRDSGVKFLDKGVFLMPGASHQDADYACQMYSMGFMAAMYDHPPYYHKHTQIQFPDISLYEQKQLEYERMNFLKTKWAEIWFNITHYHEQPPERHVRKVAMINNIHVGPAWWMAQSLESIGCEVDKYNSDEITKESYDTYIFVDDGDGKHFDCPEWAHPSIYWALDMIVPEHRRDYIFSPDIDSYVEHGRTFDKFYCSTVAAVEYARSKGLNAGWLGFAGSEVMHFPIPEAEKTLDWIALWHNCGDRIDYANAALDRFPSGFVGWKEAESYSPAVAQARCALNRSRLDEMNQRVLEMMCMGVPLITDRVNSMENYRLVEGEHYFGYHDIDSMLHAIQWVKDYPEKAQAMAERARNHVLKHHTYYRRCLQIFGGNYEPGI